MPMFFLADVSNQHRKSFSSQNLVISSLLRGADSVSHFIQEEEEEEEEERKKRRKKRKKENAKMEDERGGEGKKERKKEKPQVYLHTKLR